MKEKKKKKKEREREKRKQRKEMTSRHSQETWSKCVTLQPFARTLEGSKESEYSSLTPRAH